MDLSCEIIQFFIPMENEKNIFITNLNGELQESELYEMLQQTFQKYGLIHEIQILERPPQATAVPELTSDSAVERHFFAFVKFYSSLSAEKAKNDLTGRLYLKGQHAKMKYAARKGSQSVLPLYVTKCYALANHYLGYNGWSLRILLQEQESAGDTSTIQYSTVVELCLVKHGIKCRGYGICQQKVEPKDPCSKSVSVCLARKHSHQMAVQNAFEKVILVVFSDGRVHAEINTTVEENILQDADLIKQSIEVNNLEKSPLSSEDETESNLDSLNQNILEEMEQESV